MPDAKRTRMRPDDVWLVERVATLDEVELDNGAIRYHVQVSDEGRKPFLTRWFNDPSRAADFIEKVRFGHMEDR